MSLSNPWFIASLIGIVGWFHIKLIADLLNLSRLGKEVPEALRDIVTEEDHKRTTEYHIASTKLAVMEDATMLGATLGFWWLGGFGWLASIIASLGYGEIPSGLALIAAMVPLSMVVSLPFDWINTFKIEAEFGFNKTTVGTFIGDRLKSLVLSALLGLPLLAVILWLLQTFQWAALWAFLATVLFSLAITWIMPQFIMPLFLKFTPLESGALSEAIMALSQKLAFPVAGVFTVDGSRRSTKANAFFAGFGKTRRIALFDTLLKNHTQDEIIAVLAHEIGHSKLGHVPKQFAVGVAQYGLMFALLHIALHDERLFAAFGVAHPSNAMGLVLVSIVYEAWSHLLEPMFQGLSRKHEFEADTFARESTGSAGPMITALKKLSHDHLAHLTPHPFYVWLHYSHPPVVERLESLQK